MTDNRGTYLAAVYPLDLSLDPVPLQIGGPRRGTPEPGQPLLRP